jgi:hypothetical protein
MISTLQFDFESFPVPNEWIFENFLPINEKLIGQQVKIRSVFNSNDKDPSFMLYLDDQNRYKFVDFSSGYKGDGVDLVKLLYNIDTQEAYKKIYLLYKENNPGINTLTPTDFIKTIWTITDFKIRDWNELDRDYWTDYYISSAILEGLNIKPLLEYTFEKKRGSHVKYFRFDKPRCYGFFNSLGELCKIYNPGEKKTKYIKVRDYIQGKDQLEYKAPWLIIQSGLKDIAAFKTLTIPGIESIAADSENSVLSDDDLLFFKSKYKFISILFDNDAAGIKSSKMYEDRFGLYSIKFDIEKDVADCLKMHGPSNARAFMMKALQKTFNTYYK